jgi:membrane protein implicated in regulation of membrane protease activity
MMKIFALVVALASLLSVQAFAPLKVNTVTTTALKMSDVAVSAKMVSQLRAKTDAPMMECKKALIEAKGDFDKAEEILRVKLGNKANKVGSRIAAEGVVIAMIEGNNAVLLEANCEVMLL